MDVTTAAISGSCALAGALIGGFISWKVAKKQMERTARVAFISAGVQTKGWAEALIRVLVALRAQEGNSDELKRQCENQDWFEYFTARAPKIRQGILRNLECTNTWPEALKEFQCLLEGDWK